MIATILRAMLVVAAAGTASGQQSAGQPVGSRPMDVVARSMSIDLALEMAKEIVAACKGFHVGVSILDASGQPKLYYISDDTSGWHAGNASRKANAALTFRMPSGKVADLAKTDPTAAARIAANPGNFVTWAGGMPIFAGSEIVGAVGVSGAEPADEDERCAIVGINKIQKRLK